jgi:hypothetical protein
MRKIWLLVSVLLGIMLLASCTPKANWQEFTGPEGDFTILLPGIPKEEVQVVNSEAGDITVHLFNVPLGSFAYVVAYSDYPADLVANMGAEKLLDGARDGAVSNTRGKLLDESPVEIDGFPGRFLKVLSPDGTGLAQARMFLVGNRLYQIFVASPKSDQDSEDIQKYLDSFTLKNQPSE